MKGSPLPLPPLALSMTRRVLLAVCARRQFNDSKLERWERRNADAERVLEHEFLVHATVHENDKDKEGEKVLVWLTPADIFRVRGMEADFHQMFNDMAQEREERRVAALQPFTET
jgi:FPC/CPF motif-containing protein YcgG